MLTKNQKNVALPCMEPKRCFLINKAHDIRLSCNPAGNVSGSSDFNSWEQWHLAYEGHDLCIKSSTHGLYLQASPDKIVGAHHEAKDWEKWHIEQAPDGGCFLVSKTHGTKLACNESCKVFTTSPDCTSLDATWEFQDATGELCFMSSPVHDKRINCNIFGGLGLTDAWKGWEVWRFVETGDAGQVFITSWTHDEHFLSSSPDGKVSTTKNRDASNKWMVEKSPLGNGVELVSACHGTRLASDGHGLYMTDKTNEPSLVWQLEAAHRGAYFLSTPHHDRRVSCGPLNDGPIVLFSSKNYKGWEQWQLESTEDGLITLCSKKFGLYLGCNGSENLTTSSIAGDNEMWRLEPAPNGSVLLISSHHEMKLVCNKDGHLSTILAGGDDLDVSWQLVPHMPESTSGSQIRTRVVVGAATAACAVAMPFAVMAVIGAIGFTSTGIAGGSAAAAMMSAEAIAAGGGVVAGGTVATLQSIGAAGLGLVGTSAAVGSGAVVGGSISAAVAAGSGAFSPSSGAAPQETDSDELMTPNRSFCAWRSW